MKRVPLDAVRWWVRISLSVWEDNKTNMDELSMKFFKRLHSVFRNRDITLGNGLISQMCSFLSAVKTWFVHSS